MKHFANLCFFPTRYHQGKIINQIELFPLKNILIIHILNMYKKRDTYLTISKSVSYLPQNPHNGISIAKENRSLMVSMNK